MNMGPDEGYFYGMIIVGLAFLLSLIVYFKIHRKWLGCIMQLIAFFICTIIFGFIFAIFRSCKRVSNEAKAMVVIRQIEEDQNCRCVTTWWMKPNNTYYCEFDKSSIHYNVEPCGNDYYGDKGTFVRLDSTYAIKANTNPSFLIYFDLEKRKVTPIYNNDTIEVIKTDWKLITKYFK